METYTNKKITVFGANRSGIAITNLLHGSWWQDYQSLIHARKMNYHEELIQLDGLDIELFSWWT